MKMRLVAGLLALAAATALSVAIWTHDASDAAAASGLTPVGHPNVWMSVVSVDRQGSHYDIQAGTCLIDHDGRIRVRESSAALGHTWYTWVYDPTTQTFTRAGDSGGAVKYTRGTGISPDMGMRMSVVSPFEYSYSTAATVRAAEAEHDPGLTVKITTCLGRSAWQASYTEAGWRHTATVDQATGFPVRYVLAEVRHPLTHRSVWRVVDMATDVPVDETTFTITIPDGATVNANSDMYEHFMTPDKLAAQLGYLPFVPSDLPADSVLAASSSRPDPWGPSTWFFSIPVPWIDLSKVPDNEVKLYYHRGYDWFTITERPKAGGINNSVPAALDRPTAFGPVRFAYSKNVLQSGAFAGKTARTWVGDGGTLYVQNATYAVEICGDLTRSELLAVASSLDQ